MFGLPARVFGCVVLSSCLLGIPASSLSGSTGETTLAIARRQREVTLMTRATGTFEVKLTPQATDSAGQAVPLGRMSIEKQFQGDLQGTSVGEMLTAMTKVKGSAGYVAVERVTGTLHGRSGTFVLQHTGTMDRGAPRLSVTVVPDSGTDQLEGLTGTMVIKIESGNHFYEFEYHLPGVP